MAADARAAETQTAGPWPGLLHRPEDMLDAAALRRDLDRIGTSDAPAAERRRQAVTALAAALGQCDSAIGAAIEAQARAAHRAIHDYTWRTDVIVRSLLDFVAEHLHPRGNPTASEQLAALAVGGYGRGEMAPYSDVDLLFLTPYKQTAWGESVIESVLYCLWDLKFKVGHAVRTANDCLRLSQTDATIRTTLLEHRHIWGDAVLSETLETRLWSELFEKTGPEFVDLKLEERSKRHERQGSSRYLLEPNVKEGKGGLRDLQTLFWIGKYLEHVSEPDDLVRIGVFTADEYAVFTEAAAFLWTTRIHLHLINRRPSEQLTFDMQVELADRLGYQPTAGQRAVECFMQDYFRNAKYVGDLTRIFIAALEARHIKPRPGFGERLRSAISFSRDVTAPQFTLNHGRIDFADPESVSREPVNILRLFRERLTTGIPLHPDALRRVAANLDLIDQEVRDDPEANRIFMELLLNENNPERELRLMNETGVLGQFIPEFGRIVAMMQFNMYHHYTVDEHTIRTISFLSRLERGKMADELPLLSAELSRGLNRRVLYVALLIHDIGKGSGRDHSEYGAEIALSLCPRLGLDADETEMVSWLVAHHLLMSDTAQKRDLTDPRTTRDFAHAIKSTTRLKLLGVLTVCDICGVGPGVWNNWKASLLRTLYEKTLDFLTGGTQQAHTRPERTERAKVRLRHALSDWPEADIEAECERHYPPYWLGFDTPTHVAFAHQLRDLPAEEIRINIEQDESRDATLCCFAMADHPGIFTRLAGALSLVGANVVDARTYITSDGYATAAFWIQDHDGRPYERGHLARLRKSVERTLHGEIIAGPVLRERNRPRKWEEKFNFSTRINFDNTGSDIFTIIEVEARDRVGLLHDLLRTLSVANVPVSSSIISTYGEMAVDVFYVKDIFGLKIHSPAKQRSLEARLRAAINPPEDTPPA